MTGLYRSYKSQTIALPRSPSLGEYSPTSNVVEDSEQVPADENELHSRNLCCLEISKQGRDSAYRKHDFLNTIILLGRTEMLFR